MVERQVLQASAAAKSALAANPDVVAVGVGYRYRNGVRTDEVCVVVGVRKKLPAALVEPGRMVPSAIEGVATDVIEYGDIKAQALAARRRPCPPGYSVGHPLVTAGTLGAWIRRGEGNERYLLSNNHVIASSNDGVIGDFIRQPGTADGGSDADRFARLTEYVRIRFDSETGTGKKAAAAFAWQAWRLPANAVAQLVKCPFRLQVVPLQVGQPYPNLVDAGVARVMAEEWVDETIPSIGMLAGIRDLQLGDRVQKTGRTTEHTLGLVETVGAQVRVDYGPGRGTATFDDQFVIRGDGTTFSAGGDSGSAIVTEDGFLGGLLFAGSDEITIANRISHVVALLGVRM
jgi:hypothetical protein